MGMPLHISKCVTSLCDCVFIRATELRLHAKAACKRRKELFGGKHASEVYAGIWDMLVRGIVLWYNEKSKTFCLGIFTVELSRWLLPGKYLCSLTWILHNVQKMLSNDPSLGPCRLYKTIKKARQSHFYSRKPWLVLEALFVCGTLPKIKM